MSLMSTFVLVHSPLVGPSTWRWVAETLVARGHRVTVPTVTEVTTSRGWEAFADAVASRIDEANHAVLVGHSGAGPLLPQIASRARSRPAGLVFVDAGISSDAGETKLMPSDFLIGLKALATDGLLPKWYDWFGPEAMKALVPDDERRAVVCAEFPQLPLSYFEARVPVPEAWRAGKCGYVLLSEHYAHDAAEAARRAWPVVHLPGMHVDIVTRPEPVANAILTVVAEQL
jgi:pimeloyl-ACP methyl ester carboxylesterase